MARINLLPWREERRQERKKEFLTILGAVAASGILLVLLIGQIYGGMIDHQRGRNAYLQGHIDELNRQVREIAERSEAGGQVSFRDIANIMSGAAQVSSLGTVEVEIVKTAGGNWAEHQWVKESLRTAWLQKDSNEAVEHNYALYQKYEDQLSALITQ